MKLVFADSNVFLRFFTADDVEQHRRAERLFLSARKGECEIAIGPPVLFEVACTLRAAYKLPRAQTRDVLARIVTMPAIRVLDADLVEQALTLAGELDREFADAYIAVSARAAGADSIATFNQKHFDGLGVPLHRW